MTFKKKKGGGEGGGGGDMTKKEVEARLESLYTPEDIAETRCAVPFLQRLATKESYVLVHCLVGTTLGMFFTYTVSVLSTIEKRFKLKSRETGIVLAGNDISQVLLAIFLSYYGTFGHRPRWLGVGALFTAASCFTAALPHFLYGAGESAEALVESLSITNLTEYKSTEELCHTGSNEECEGQTRGSEYYTVISLLFLSQFFVGIAISIFYTLGLTYLDDNTNKKTFSFYYTLNILLRILGPVIGFMIGGRALSVWIDPSKDPNLSKEDPRWLGAWWLGLLLIGAAVFTSSLPLFLFPRKLPATLRREGRMYIRKAEKNRLAGGSKSPHDYKSRHVLKRENSKPNIKNLVKALRRLFKNKIWAGHLFTATVTIFAVSGYWSFKPKYLENQFRKSAAEANYYTGLASLIVSVVGSVVSGAVMRWGRPGPRYVTGYNIFITVVSTLGFISLAFVGCPKVEVVGPVQGAMVPSCSADCECSDKYTPICSQDGETLFYSPCYAGCLADNTTAKPVEYSKCKCIDSASTPHNGSIPARPPAHLDDTLLPPSEWGMARRGYCPEPCNGFFYYFLVQIITKTISTTGQIGGTIVVLRAVSDEDKGISLGTITVFISLFGFIPAPIVMGAIIDSACVVWDKTCGVTGNCWLYDSDHFRRVLHLTPAVLMALSIAGEVVVFRYSHKLDLYGLKEEEEDDDGEDEEQGHGQNGNMKHQPKELEEGEEAIPLCTELTDGVNM